MKNPEDRWWPALLYVGNLSNGALGRIRANISIVHTSLCDGECIIHLATYQAQIDQIEKTPTLKTAPDGQRRLDCLHEVMRWKKSEFEKIKQLWDRPRFRDARGSV